MKKAVGLAILFAMAFYAYAGWAYDPAWSRIDLPHTKNNVGSPVAFEAFYGGNVSEPVCYYKQCTYKWDFGDGTTAYGRFVTKYYNASKYAGYNVSMSVLVGNVTDSYAVRAVPVWIPGDTNGDGRVTLQEVFYVADRRGARYGDPRYDDGADLNNDNVIDNVDLNIVVNAWRSG